MSNKLADGEGIYEKYIVIPRARIVKLTTDPESGLAKCMFEPEVLDNQGKFFPLNMEEDQAALLAVEEYGMHCYPTLSRSVASRVEAIRRGGMMNLSRTGQLNVQWIGHGYSRRGWRR